jgi:hypothetical protein
MKSGTSILVIVELEIFIVLSIVIVLNFLARLAPLAFFLAFLFASCL